MELCPWPSGKALCWQENKLVKTKQQMLLTDQEQAFVWLFWVRKNISYDSSEEPPKILLK